RSRSAMWSSFGSIADLGCIGNLLEAAVVGDDGLVAEHGRRLDRRVAADMAVAAEDRSADARFASDPPVRPDDRAVDDRTLVDVRLAADDRVGKDAGAGLDH